MNEIRDCWRRDLSLLNPQQRRSAGYALRLLSLPRDLIAGRLDSNRLGLLWGMLQPLFEPRHLIDYLRPPQGVADIVHQDDDAPEVLDTYGLADDAVEVLDTGDLADYAPPADAPLTTSDDEVMLALGYALQEEEIMAIEAEHDPVVMELMPAVYMTQRLRWLFRRGDPLTLARLDAANPEQVPASPTVALLGASLHLDGPTLSVLDFLDEFIATPGLGELLRRVDNLNSRRRHFPRLAAVLDLPEAALRQVLAKEAPLRRLGLVEFAPQTCGMQDFLRPSPLLREVLEAAPTDDAALLALLIEPAPPAAWPLTAFPHLETAARLAGETLAAAVATRAVGVNALLYGPPGTGKTELARALAAAQGLRAYQVRSADEDGDGLQRAGRLAAYQVAQHLLARRGQALVFFDEAEDVFTPNDPFQALLDGAPVSGRQKGWMNRILEDNPVPALWITNSTTGMDPAFLRRFLLPVACGLPPRAVRRQMAERHLGDRGLPPALLDDLAADPALAPAQLGAARRLLELCPTAAPEPRVRAGLGALRTQLHGAPAPRRRPAPTRFDVAFLNLAGDLRPSAIVQALARRGQGSLCFYGPPGTGKTAFAEILAAALDRELVAFPASDLLSPWNGETERNLAALFRDGDPRQTVLLLDEVDSFLTARQAARQAWERTQVNELLQQMERYPGIFIAATNLISGLDPAALRRFDFKLHFRALTPAQRRALFAREALGDDQAPVPEALARPLDTLTGLTPGDFATVCRQRELLGEVLTPEQFLRRLAGEWRMKQVEGREAA